MQNSQYEIEAVDRFFDALRQDSNALPPAELDHKTVELIRALAETKTPEAPDQNIQDRVWNRVLFATYAPPDIEPVYSTVPPVRESVAQPPRVKPTRIKRFDISFLVAALFAVVCLAGLLFQYTDTVVDNMARYSTPHRIPVESLPADEGFSRGIHDGDVSPPRNLISQQRFYFYTVAYIQD